VLVSLVGVIVKLGGLCLFGGFENKGNAHPAQPSPPFVWIVWIVALAVVL
jgi:hypothetical protein